MTPEETTAAFEVLSESHPDVVGNPTNDVVQSLRKALLSVLLDGRLSTDSGITLAGLIQDEKAFIKKHGKTFDRMTKTLADYDPSITKDTANADCRRLEQLHIAKRADQALIRAAERGARNFILAKVEATHVSRLADEETLYSEVTPRALL